LSNHDGHLADVGRKPWHTACAQTAAGGRLMLWTLIVLLLLFWLLGFAFDVAGGIVHVLLVIAVVLFLVNLISGRRTVV
jgi:uncharacterized membrane protein YtjA (UPF0391 family)